MDLCGSWEYIASHVVIAVIKNFLSIFLAKKRLALFVVTRHTVWR